MTFILKVMLQLQYVTLNVLSLLGEYMTDISQITPVFNIKDFNINRNQSSNKLIRHFH